MKNIVKTTLIILIFVSIFSGSQLAVNAGRQSDSDDYYRVQVDPEDVLMNLTLEMKRGDIIEYNITITNANSSLTLICEILDEASGRLWTVYIEKADVYYAAKKTESYADFERLMDHVSNYTVKHVTRSSGDYVLAFHQGMLHEEPDVRFNFLVLNGTVGIETHIGSGMDMSNMTHDMSSTEQATTSSLDFVFIMIGIFVIPLYTLISKRKR